jgi:hypothetical protein
MPSETTPPSSTPSPSGPPIGTLVLLVLASMLYALMLANLTDSSGTDAAGRGLNQAFAALVGLLLWSVLAILLVVAAVKGAMPPAGLAAILLLPASAVGAVVAAGLVEREPGWPIVVPALLPPLIAAYAVWARLPQLHARLKPLPTSLAIGAAIVALSAAPFIARSIAERPDPARDARLAAEYQARQAEEQRQMKEAQEREAAKFAALGPDSSMADYLAFAYGDHSREVRVGIRKVKSRQADAVALLQQGKLGSLVSLLEFDVEATPALCRAFGDALAGAARGVDPKVRSDYLTAAIDLEWQLPNMQWLVGEHCDLKESLALLEKNVRAVADSSRMTKFADTLAGLRTR